MVGPVGPNRGVVRRVVGGFGGDRANMVCLSVEETERENGKERKREREV